MTRTLAIHVLRDMLWMVSFGFDTPYLCFLRALSLVTENANIRGVESVAVGALAHALGVAESLVWQTTTDMPQSTQPAIRSAIILLGAAQEGTP